MTARLAQYMRERVQQDVRSTRERTLRLPVIRPPLVSSHEVIDPVHDRRTPLPFIDCGGTELDEHPFPTILHGREPLWVQGDLRALHVRFVLALDVRRDCFEACEAG